MARRIAHAYALAGQEGCPSVRVQISGASTEAAGGSTSLPLSRAGKGGRAVECTGLENRQAGNPRLGSSNLPPSVPNCSSQSHKWFWDRALDIVR
jgi:hypothetical protein